MKKLTNHFNRMILNRYRNSKRIVTINKNQDIVSILNRLLDSNKSLELTLRKRNKSFGLIYHIYFNAQSSSYGSDFKKQDILQRGVVFHLLLDRIIKYNPDFLLIKTKKNINDFNRYVNRKQKSLYDLT